MAGSAVLGTNVVDVLVPVADDIRDLATELGAHQFRVYTVKRTYSSQVAGEGSYTDVETEITPRPVVEARLKWGQLDDFPFDLVTSYENCRFCKPHRQYFGDILHSLGLDPQQAIMVGIDTEYDLPAQQAGLATFLLDTCLIDHHNRSAHADFFGSHHDLLELVRCIAANRRNN